VNLQANVKFFVVLQHSSVLYQQGPVRLDRVQQKSVASVEAVLGLFSGTIFRHNVINGSHAYDFISFHSAVH